MAESQRVEIMRRGFAALNAGDHQVWMDMYADDARVHELEEIPDRQTLQGHEGLREWLTNLQAILGEFTFEPVAFEEKGDWVVVATDGRGMGTGAGVPVQWRAHMVFRFRGEKIAEAWGFLDEAKAREQAGLPPREGVG